MVLGSTSPEKCLGASDLLMGVLVYMNCDLFWYSSPTVYPYGRVLGLSQCYGWGHDSGQVEVKISWEFQSTIKFQISRTPTYLDESQIIISKVPPLFNYAMAVTLKYIFLSRINSYQ